MWGPPNNYETHQKLNIIILPPSAAQVYYVFKALNVVSFWI